MFRALICPSSGGKIVFTQHLVWSLSVNGCTVHRLRADSEMLNCTIDLSFELAVSMYELEFLTVSKVYIVVTSYSLVQCFSTAGPRPGTGP